MVKFSEIFKRPAADSQQHPPETKPKEEPLKETSKEPLEENPKPQGNVLASDSQSHPEKPKPVVSNEVKVQKEQTETRIYNQAGVSNPMDKEAVDISHSTNLYFLGIQLVRELFINTEQLKPVNLIQIKQWVSEVVKDFISGDTELLNLFYGYASENYLYEHTVNTAIISIEIGLGLGYDEAQANELGLAAFLHDIGMIKVGKLEMQPRSLSDEEYNKIKQHPLYGADILSNIQGIPNPVIYVIKEEHERNDGSGYPNGAKRDEISEYGKIVAVADVYEALTHDRPYRKKKFPHDVIKELLSKGDVFDPLVLKALINKIGVYPISSWVELNSSEIGRVVKNNEKFPLRPVLAIFFDTKKIILKEPRLINLAEQFNLFIKRVILEDNLLETIEKNAKFNKR